LPAIYKQAAIVYVIKLSNNVEPGPKHRALLLATASSASRGGVRAALANASTHFNSHEETLSLDTVNTTPTTTTSTTTTTTTMLTSSKEKEKETPRVRSAPWFSETGDSFECRACLVLPNPIKVPELCQNGVLGGTSS